MLEVGTMQAYCKKPHLSRRSARSLIQTTCLGNQGRTCCSTVVLNVLPDESDGALRTAGGEESFTAAYVTEDAIYGAASPRRRPPPPMVCPPPHPSPKPRLSFQQTVIRHPRNCPPKLGLAPWPTGGSGSTWNHKTGNHRGGVGKDNPQHREPQGPLPFPSPSTHR